MAYRWWRKFRVIGSISPYNIYDLGGGFSPTRFEQICSSNWCQGPPWFCLMALGWWIPGVADQVQVNHWQENSRKLWKMAMKTLMPGDSSRDLSIPYWKGSLNHHKKVTKNCQVFIFNRKTGSSNACFFHCHVSFRGCTFPFPPRARQMKASCKEKIHY